MNCEWKWDPSGDEGDVQDCNECEDDDDECWWSCEWPEEEWEMSGDEGEEEEGTNPYMEAIENGADPYDVYEQALEDGVDPDEAYAAYMDIIANLEGGDEELDLTDCATCMAQPDYTSCWTTCTWAEDLV